LGDARRTRVWDPFVRAAHWALAALILVDLLNEAGANPWHRYLGYAAALIVAARLAWGLALPGYASLPAMARRARQALPYLKSLRPSSLRPSQAYAGHNPLGALMAFALWTLTLAAGVTGWMLGLDAFWGEQWLQDLHAASAYTLAGCAAVHVAAAVLASLRRENLVKAMITGDKSVADSS
jgi:cytochrome b